MKVRAKCGNTSYVLLAFIGAVVLIAYVMRSRKTEAFGSGDSGDAAIGDVILGNVGEIGEAGGLASKLTSFVPKAGALYNSPERNIVVGGVVGATWLLDYNAHLRKALTRCLSELLAPPNTLVVCLGANFVGDRVVFVPAVAQGVVAGDVLYKELLRPVGAKPLGFVFSCIVPAGWVARFKYEGNREMKDFSSGVYSSVMASGYITEITLMQKI